MSVNPTNISWATHTWNPITGCSPCSPGCENCYAKQLHDQRHKAYLEGKKVAACYAEPFDKITMHQERLYEPMRLRKPGIIFVGSMTDLFHPDVPDEWIDSVFATMAQCPKHTFMILTKRAARMEKYIKGLSDVEGALRFEKKDMRLHKYAMAFRRGECLPNVWLNVTICNQEEADETLPHLLATPAAHRGVSIEPMLGPVDLTGEILKDELGEYPFPNLPRTMRTRRINMLDLVICGGETGKRARGMHPDWVRSIRDQCQEAGVPFHFKQWGEWLPVATQDRFDPYGWSGQDDDTYHESQVQVCQPSESVFANFVRVGSKRAGHLLDGVEHRAMPGEEE